MGIDRPADRLAGFAAPVAGVERPRSTLPCRVGCSGNAPALLGGHYMIKITSLATIAAALLACGLAAAPAEAGLNRTFVSGTGTDSGTCTRAAPCRTFAFALTQTAAGGEIDVLDPAGYGTVTIAKAISIVNDGAGTAGIRGAGPPSPDRNGVTINAGASDSVHLRGLTIAGFESGAGSGIQFNSGGNLAIENCVIRGFADGINIVPSKSSNFSVSNTIVSDNGANGIIVLPTGSPAVAGVISNVTAYNNFTGIVVGSDFMTGGSINVTIVDSEVSKSPNGGILATAPSLTTAVLVRNSVASNNGTGLLASGSGAILRAAHSVVTGNGTGVNTRSGGILNSYGDNDINGNTNDNTAALTPIFTH
ncbi:MAG: hypothetical protein ACREDT_00420 [Methylocella sp.]